MKKQLLHILLFSFLVGKCYGIGDPGGVWLGIVNNSEITIGCVTATRQLKFGYPDTLLPPQKVLDKYTSPDSREHMTYVPPDSLREVFFCMAYSWAHALDWETNHGYLSVYVFSKDTLDQRPWEYIRCNNNYIVRYDLTEIDLIKISRGESERLITFPPTEVMRDVHMYPPFGVVYEEWKDRKGPVSGGI